MAFAHTRLTNIAPSATPWIASTGTAGANLGPPMILIASGAPTAIETAA